jgi:hypothetical protein
MFCRFLYYQAMNMNHPEHNRDRVFTSMLESLLNNYIFVPSLRSVNLRDMDMDNTENILYDRIQNTTSPRTSIYKIGSTTSRIGGTSVVFGRLVQIKDKEYIIVSQSDNYRIIHYIKHSLEIIKGYEQEQPLKQNEVFGVPKFIVDEIYASSPGSLENIKRRFNRVLCDLNSSELEADNLWPYRHELRIE